jgi:integrase
MDMKLRSAFAGRLAAFLAQKRALGYAYASTSDFTLFDRLCAESFPEEMALTAEICNAWAARRGNESAKTTNRRLPFIREFARYLVRSGEKAHILPAGIVKKGQRHIPHIYSQDEIKEILRVVGGIRPSRDYPAAHVVLPALFRLLYCCGMRPSEALKLKASDANLRSGKLFIAESKGNRDRIVMLSDDALELCRIYDRRMRALMPGRVFFFAKNTCSACAYGWLSQLFRKSRGKMKIETADGKPPRLYDLRHTFATHRLYQWMRDGKDLYAMLPYLSAYMGHQKLTETFYYIHLVPGMLETMSGFEFASVRDIFPEVPADE